MRFIHKSFLMAKKYCLCINVENISLMEMILCTDDGKERKEFEYFLQHMRIKPSSVFIDIDSDNTAMRIASTYFPETEILADTMYVSKTLVRKLRLAYNNTLKFSKGGYSASLLRDKGKDIFFPEYGKKGTELNDIRQKLKNSYPTLWNQYRTYCDGQRPYKVAPKKQETTFDSWEEDVMGKLENEIFVPALINEIKPSKNVS